ncbi:hypothetical protein C8035_v004946 [Colletotrichum spinosum]|uniref:Uncharacterized protein n=1 Tax=Colletotrichum spinosum TaxID=1347390 RepID=A0A4R8QUW4_9PEZI|nr:hypothetical protein C8035_v004946 [Colletotrichum spinosum]
MEFLARLHTDGISKALGRKHKPLSRDELEEILPSELSASAYDQGWDREDEARLRTEWEEDMKRDDISRYTHHCMPKLIRACLCFFRESPFDITSEKNLLRMATAKWQTRLCMSLYDLIPHPLWDSHWELRVTAVQYAVIFLEKTVDTDRRGRQTATDGPPRFYVVTPKDLANITDALDGTYNTGMPLPTVSCSRHVLGSRTDVVRPTANMSDYIKRAVFAVERENSKAEHRAGRLASSQEARGQEELGGDAPASGDEESQELREKVRVRCETCRQKSRCRGSPPAASCDASTKSPTPNGRPQYEVFRSIMAQEEPRRSPPQHRHVRHGSEQPIADRTRAAPRPESDNNFVDDENVSHLPVVANTGQFSSALLESARMEAIMGVPRCPEMLQLLYSNKTRLQQGINFVGGYKLYADIVFPLVYTVHRSFATGCTRFEVVKQMLYHSKENGRDEWMKLGVNCPRNDSRIDGEDGYWREWMALNHRKHLRPLDPDEIEPGVPL